MRAGEGAGHAEGEDWDEAPVALVAVDASGTVLAVNGTAAAWVGLAREDLVGRRRIGDLLTVAGRMFWETHVSPLLLTGELVSEVAVELLAPTGRIPVLLSARPVAGGGALLALASAGHRAEQDRQVRAAGREAAAASTALRGLQRATAALSAAAGTGAVCSAGVTAAVDALDAGSAQLWVPPPGQDDRQPRGRLELRLTRGDSGSAADEPPRVPADTVPTYEGDDLLVALRGQEQLHGVLRLARRGGASAGPFDTDLAEALGLQISLALDRAVTYERSASISHQLQQSLLAAPVPCDPRFSVAAVYRPAEEGLEVGGDWHDAFLDDAGRLSFLVGDVVGHGLGAAAAMGQLRSAVRAVAGGRVAPAAMMTRLDRFVGDLPAAELATLAYGVLDLDTGELAHACAGHLPPLLLSADGGAQLLWEGRGMPLSSFLGGDRRDSRLVLDPGDRLLLYTDGLVERRDRSMEDGLEALRAVAASLRGAAPQQAATELTRLLLRDEGVRDDVCVLLLDWHGVTGATAAS